MKHSIGIMQGRLTPSNNRGIQFFPFEYWEEEFYIGKEIGLNEIEFIFDYENHEDNPLWTSVGRNEIREAIEKSGVKIHAVCFDYFMRRPFFKEQNRIIREDLYQENKKILFHILKAMEELKISLIEIPLVDASSLKNEEEKKEFINFIFDILKEAPKLIKIGLETDLPPLEFRQFLERIGEDRVGANYDTGNSSGLGYNPNEEVRSLDKYIFNIHIKDRLLGGMTQPLGTGSADFDVFFQAVKAINYHGNFILQAARGEDGREKENIVSQIEFVQDYIKKYEI